MIAIATGRPSWPIAPMLSRSRVLLFLLLFFIAGLFPAFTADGPGDGWAVACNTIDVTVYSRPHGGTSLRECKAVGLIDAEPIVVKRVLDDTAE
jgi:hypothetical protein